MNFRVGSGRPSDRAGVSPTGERRPGLSAIDELVGRPAAAIVNSKKAALLTLVDPFAIGPGWFALNLNTFHVERGDAAPEAERSRIEATLPVLNHRICVKGREEYLHRYRLGPGAGGFDLVYLEYRAPFIASELRRQGQLAREDV